MSNPFDWEHDSANEGLSALAADLGVDKTAQLSELRMALSVGIDHYGCIHGTVLRGDESEEREIYLRGMYYVLLIGLKMCLSVFSQVGTYSIHFLILGDVVLLETVKLSK